MRILWFLFLVSFLPNWVATALGQDSPAIVTDRPSFTTGPALMSPDAWQVELGYTFRDGVGDTNEDVGTFPETLLRYGLNDKWELRLGWNGYDFVDDASDMAGDTSVGFKYAFGDQLVDGVSMALITTVSLPTGSGESELDPQFLLGWDYALDDNTMLAGNFGVGSPTDEMTGDRYAQGVLSLMCSRTFNDVNSGFAEYYTNFPAADDEDAEHVFQVGLMHLLNPDTQVDVRAGVGLNNQADDWFVGIGFSRRF